MPSTSFHFLQLRRLTICDLRQPKSVKAGSFFHPPHHLIVVPGADLRSFIVRNIRLSRPLFTWTIVIVVLGTNLFLSCPSILIVQRRDHRARLLNSFCSVVHNTNLIVQNIPYSLSSGTLRLQIPSTFLSILFLISHQLQQLTQQQPQDPQTSTQLKSNLSKKHASHLRHVLNQQHPRHFGPCSFHHHSPGAHGDGLASTIRQSRQQPTQCRWFKLPMQSHEQFWWHRHQHGYRRPADALLPGRICAWRWILSSLSYYRYTCNEEL